MLPDVYESIRGDRAFDHLRTEGIVLVPGEGSSRPKALIVGEAPGALENTQRRPFVGASGRVLRSLIKDTAQLDAADYFITNVVKYRPPGNRTPEPAEIEAARPYLRQEWSALGRPRVMVAVGGTAFNALWPSDWARLGGVAKYVGRPHEVKGGCKLWVMYHPAYGLRNASVRPEMEEHWERFGDWMREKS
jgi:uracil-DNA glycosylase